MSCRVVLQEGVVSPIPDQIQWNANFLATAIKTHETTYHWLNGLRRFFRDSFYLPMNRSCQDPFFIDGNAYAQQFVAMLKGQNPDLDGTFSHLPQMIENFAVRDVPVEVQSGEMAIVFQTRVIESKEEINGKKLRLIIFSFVNHQVMTQNSLSPWDPMHIDELSGSILDILKAYQQHVRVDSMMCFSLGCLAFDGLKHITPEDSSFIPQTLIFNRGLSSIQKVSQKLYPFPISTLLYNAIYYLGLDANPERELLHFFQRIQSSGAPLNRRQVVIIEARHDRYFSGKGKLDANFHSALAETGVPTYHGTFFMPLIAETSHHAIRLDWITNNQDAGTDTAHFLPFPKNHTLAEGLVANILQKTVSDGTHTCLIVGGNRDTLDTITYLEAAPLIAAYLQNVGDR